MCLVAIILIDLSKFIRTVLLNRKGKHFSSCLYMAMEGNQSVLSVGICASLIVIAEKEGEFRQYSLLLIYSIVISVILQYIFTMIIAVQTAYAAISE